MDRQAAVYILTNKRNGTLYIGVTSKLVQRIWQHRNDCVESFSSKYQAHRLVYYELHAHILDAIQREKRLKKWNRLWKIELIESNNPLWRDLWEELL